MTQKQALDILKMGHNVFITGAAGSGKTHLLNQYINYLREREVPIGITASTGIAATHMNGMTIHAWSGIGIRNTITSRDLHDLEERSYLWKRMEEAKVLILDEISMLHHFRLDMIEKVVRTFKRNEEPFGGMQVILCGDFFQLPPVARRDEPPAQFAYHAPAWKNLNLRMCYLEEQHRQNDDAYLQVLNEIRGNEVSERTHEILTSRFGQKTDGAIEPTKLYSHNVDVDAENNYELEKLEGEPTEYIMKARGREILVGALKKSCLAPERLALKVGARVMFVKNNFEKGYANGTLGIVEHCSDFSIRVKTTRGKIINVELGSWSVDENGETKARIEQYPLRLAWAITIHKSQGMSLDAAEIDLRDSFEKGMGYVALSRVRTLGGLSLKGLNQGALMVNEEVLEFDQSLRDESRAHEKELAAKTLAEVETLQKKFMEKIAPKGSRKAPKKDTVEETKKLFEAGKHPKEIAKERNLKIRTIFDHLEKIQTREPSFDFSSLQKYMTAPQYKKITTALMAAGMEGGVYRLAPAKILLGESVSYDDIQIARLLLMTRAKI